MFDYEEACPVSKAASLLCERWTLQIIREMLLGAARFSELQKYLPKISPTLLNARLRSLEQNGLIIRRQIAEKKGFEYRLTPAGQSILPILQEMGKWGMQWSSEKMNPAELNVSVLTRDYAFALRHDALPSGAYTMQFNFTDSNNLIRKYIFVRPGHAQVCDENLGNEVDLYMTASLTTFGQIWYGELSVKSACANGSLKVSGDPLLQATLPKWLGTSQFAPYNRHHDSAPPLSA